MKIHYNEALDQQVADSFGPINRQALRLDNSIKVTLIKND